MVWTLLSATCSTIASKPFANVLALPNLRAAKEAFTPELLRAGWETRIGSVPKGGGVDDVPWYVSEVRLGLASRMLPDVD